MNVTFGINTGEVARTQSGGECDSFRALAVISPGCSATVVKPHRAWIPTLHFHPPFYALQMAAPRAAIETHLVTGCWHLRGCRACAPLLNFL